MYDKFGVPAFGLQLGVRYALFGLGGHAMFTAIFGASLGLALQTRRKWLRILAPILGVLLAMTAHMLNNALPLFATLARSMRARYRKSNRSPTSVSQALLE
jgi:RsiW-degrading membrane proteinase PrsW (M82 family)